MQFDVTFLLVFSRFYAVLARKVIFAILVFDIIISLIYLNIYLKTFFMSTDENGAYQASIDIGTIYVLLFINNKRL